MQERTISREIDRLVKSLELAISILAGTNSVVFPKRNGSY